MAIPNQTLETEPSNAGVESTSWGYSDEGNTTLDRAIDWGQAVVGGAREIFGGSDEPLNDAVGRPSGGSRMEGDIVNAGYETPGGVVGESYGSPGLITLNVPDSPSIMTKAFNSTITIGDNFTIPAWFFFALVAAWGYRKNLGAAKKALTKGGFKAFG